MKKTRADHLPENSAADRKQILLVEDERELREVLALGLRRARYTVDVAATATEAAANRSPILCADHCRLDASRRQRDRPRRSRFGTPCQNSDHQRVFVRV